MFRYPMHLACAFAFALLVLVPHLRADDPVATDRDALKKLIPAATAMSAADYDKLTKSAAAPTLADFDSKCLTLVLVLSTRGGPDADETLKAEFSFPDGPPTAAALVNEMYRTAGVGRVRIATAPVTLVHYERITDITCEVAGDTARGMVRYVVPKLCRGSFHYTATRRAGSPWQIAEIQMPAHEIHLVRNEKGHWVRK